MPVVLKTCGLVAVLLSLLAIVATAAKTPFERQLVRADSLLARREAGAAVHTLDSLLAGARSLGDRGDEMRVLLAQARLHGLIGNPKPSRASATRALELAIALRDSLGICKALRWLTVAAQVEGEMGEARGSAQRLLELARACGDHLHEGHACLLLAYDDLMAGRLAAAEPLYIRAAELLQEGGDLRFELMARTGLGRVLETRGDIDGARSCYEQILEGSRKLGDPFSGAHALNNLGVLEFNYGDPSAAAEYYRRAFDLQVNYGNPEGSIIPASNLAIIHDYLGEYEDAARILEETQRRCDEAGYHAHDAIVLEQMATVRKDQGRLHEAAALFRRGAAIASGKSSEQVGRHLLGLAQTLALCDSIEAGVAVLTGPFEEVRPLLPPEVVFNAERLHGELLFRSGRFAKALERFRIADRVGRLLGLAFRVHPLTYSARCHAAMGRRDSARVYLDRAVEAWESERARIRDPIWREQLQIDGRLLYSELASHTLSDTASGSASELARSAFDALQRFKARTLRERMLGAFERPGAPPGVSPGVSRGVSPGAPPGVPRGVSPGVPPDASPDAPPDAPPGASPEAPSVVEIPAAAAVLELQTRCLSADELLLDFFLGTDEIYLFGVTRSECRAARIPYDTELLQRTLERYRDLVSRRPDPARSADEMTLIEGAGRSLSSLLLSSVSDLLRTHSRIILAPDGCLNMIPIEALPPPQAPKNLADQELPRAQRRIVRVPSASVLRDQRSRAAPTDQIKPHAGILVVRDRSDSLGLTLPGARGETAWLRRFFRDVRIVQDVQVGDPGARGEGSGQDEDLSRFEIIHLASHVEIDDAHPWRSGLPQLRAHQVAAMRLPARLAVLAGCESAGGRVVSGEGVLGLTAAFAAAGVPSVVATLWPVSDRVTARLMRAFYRSLEGGRSIGEALDDAKEAVRRNPRTRHPFYWAGFVLEGEDGATIPIERRRTSKILPFLLAALVIMVGGVGLISWSRGRQPL